MVQYNYFDENNQAGRSGVLYASSKGMPVFAMEPLRGGMLVDGLPKEAVMAFAKADKKRTLTGWGLAWLYDQPEITMALSGMSNLKMLEENAALASSLKPGCLSDTDRAAYTKALAAIRALERIPCTGCNYCMPCPYGVGIPTCFEAYNNSYMHGRISGITRYFMTAGGMHKTQSFASQCKRCGKCEPLCPQAIEIADRLGDVSRRLEGFWLRPVCAAARRIMLGR
jgi:predicted aldo/keto reductase-like oxidoreductase